MPRALELRVGEEITDRVDRPRGNDRLLQGGEKVVALPERGLRHKLALHLDAVRHSRQGWSRSVGRRRARRARASPQSRANCPSLPTATIS